MKVDRRIESNLPLWEIPRGWFWVFMGDVTNIIGGGTPSTLDPKNFENGNVSWITPADLSKYENKYISGGARNLSLKGLQGCGAKLMPTGTVLLSSRAPIGYLAIAGKPLCTNQGFKSFVLGPGLKADYVYYYLKRAKNIIIGLASGTTFLELSGAKAALIPMPIAPFSEQHRVVEEIEKQFTRLDAAVNALKRVRANLKRYRASVLKAACEGRLVPTEAEIAKKEGRSYEPSDVLLKRILKERRAKWEADQLAQMEAKGKSPKDDKWKEKYIEPIAPDLTHLPKLPKGWIWASVKQITAIVQYGTSAKTDSDTKGVPVLRMGNIINGKIYFDQLKFLQDTHDEFPQLLLTSGDILFNRTNSAELVGKTAVYHGSPKPCSFASYLIRLRLMKNYSPEFLAYYINSIYGRNWIKEVVSQQVGQANVNGTKLQSLTVPVPPVVEQRRIVEEIDRRLSIIEGLETVVQTNLKKADRLRQSILKQAFEGKLVPQDCNDEPVIELLTKIGKKSSRAQKRP